MLNSNSRRGASRVLLAAGLALFAGAAVAHAQAPQVETPGEGVEGASLLPPRVIDAPPPVFPYRGRLSDLDEGAWVIVRVDVDAQGRPGAATVKRTPLGPVYQASALKAVTRWTFEPAMRDGVAVAQSVLVPVVFGRPKPDRDFERSRPPVNGVEPLTLQMVRPPPGPVQAPSAGIRAD